MIDKWRGTDKSQGTRQFDAEQRKAFCYEVQNGKLVSAVDKSVLTTKSQTKMQPWDAAQAMENIAESENLKLDELNEQGWLELTRKVEELGAMMIYVMNTQGRIFVAKEQPKILHHSSFLAGGAVAGAGAIRTTADGTINFISNKSGHYEPAPAYLWQVLRNLVRHGVDLAGIHISVLGMKGIFNNALQFYQAFDPSRDPRYFDNAWGVAELDRYLESHK